MNNEFPGGAKGRTWTPIMIIMGSKDKLGVFMENEKI